MLTTTTRVTRAWCLLRWRQGGHEGSLTENREWKLWRPLCAFLLSLLTGKWTSSILYGRIPFSKVSIFLSDSQNILVFRTRFRTPVKALICTEYYQRRDLGLFILNSCFFLIRTKQAFQCGVLFCYHWLMFIFRPRDLFLPCLQTVFLVEVSSLQLLCLLTFVQRLPPRSFIKIWIELRDVLILKKF